MNLKEYIKMNIILIYITIFSSFWIIMHILGIFKYNFSSVFFPCLWAIVIAATLSCFACMGE